MIKEVGCTEIYVNAQGCRSVGFFFSEQRRWARIIDVLNAAHIPVNNACAAS